MKIVNYIKKSPVLLIAFACFVMIGFWYKEGSLFAGGEEGIIFYDLKKHQYLVSQAWYEVEVGLPVIAFLPRIPYFWVMSFLANFISPVILQAASFLFLMLTAGVSTYFLAKELLAGGLNVKSKRATPAIAGFFYIANPYSMTQVWGRGLTPQFFAFAAAPLFLLLFTKLLSERKLTYLVATLFAFIFLAPAFVLITNVVVVWAVIFLYLVFYIFRERTVKKALTALSCFVFFLGSWLVINAWWVIPTFGGAEVFSSSMSASQENIGTLLGVSAHFPLSAVLRLMQRYYFFVAKIYGEIYSSLAFEAISWLIPAVSVFSLTYLKRIKNLKYILGLFVVGLFVSLGANKPAGSVFLWFFKTFPFLQAFRNPYEKFGLVLMLAYAFLFALGLERLTFKKQKLKIALLAIVCGVFVWPLWAGTFAGKYSWIQVPPYYKDADKWLNAQEGDFRIMQLPLLAGDGVRYTWERPYNGIEPGAFLFTRQSIGRNVGVKGFYNVLLQRFGNFSPGIFGPDPDITNSDFREESLWEELAKLNVRYIVFHNDLVDDMIGGGVTKEDFRKYLNAQEKIKKVGVFGQLDIYEVDIPEYAALIFSQDADVQYTKLSQTHYVGRVEGVKSSPKIYFLSTFNNNWEMFVNGQKVKDHFLAFSYANGWRVERNEAFDFEIKYKLQQAADVGAKISLSATTIPLGLGALLTVFKKYAKKNK